MHYILFVFLSIENGVLSKNTLSKKDLKKRFFLKRCFLYVNGNRTQRITNILLFVTFYSCLHKEIGV